MPGSRCEPGEVDLDAGAAAAGRLARRACQAGRSHVLDTGDGVGGEQFEAGFEEQFFAEGIADLYRRAVFLRFFSQVARSEGRACEAVAARLRSYVKDWVANTLGRAARNLLVLEDAEAKDIH